MTPLRTRYPRPVPARWPTGKCQAGRAVALTKVFSGVRPVLTALRYPSDEMQDAAYRMNGQLETTVPPQMLTRAPSGTS